MMYNVKLSDAAIENLRNMIGIADGKINLKTGVIQLNGTDNLKKIAGKFSIDNVDHKPYSEVVPETVVNPSSLEERNRIIGYDLEVGSVVRVKVENGVEHAVIIATKDNLYAAARLMLSKVTPETYRGPEGTLLIPLKKGEDIVYRNMTYRDLVTLVGETAYDLEWRDFMKGAGGMIVGKVTNMELIQPIIDLAAGYLNQEDSGEEATEEEAVQQEEPSPEEEEKKGIDFLQAIENAESLDDLFAELGVASEILKQAAMECIETGRSNVKKLIPVLQSKYDKAYGRLSQSAIKNKMNEEVKEWCESHDVALEECSVSYFLKTIVKGLKKS